MAKKTNKTSHVLNLITNGSPSDTETPLAPEHGGVPGPSGQVSSQTETAPGVPAQTVEVPGVPDQAASAPGAPFEAPSAPGVPAQTVSVPGAPFQASSAPGVPAQTAAPSQIAAAGAFSHAAAVLEAAAAEDHAAALRENAAALRESAAALREAVAPAEGGGTDSDGEEEGGAVTPPDESMDPSPHPAGSPETDTPPQEEASPFKEEESGPGTETPAPQQESLTGIKDTHVKEPQAMHVSSGDKKVIVVNKSGENDKISNEILNHLTSHLEEENMAKQEVYCMVNVMEKILDHINLDKQMETYEVCMCSRCRADIKALILTRLPAKYVVVGEDSVAPIIGYYENKFRVRILTEIIKACMDVKSGPRHGSTECIQYIKE